MFNSLNNHNDIWNTALVIAATIIVSALIFSITAASMTSPQPDYIVDGQAEQVHNTGLALLTLGLATLPLVICSLTFRRSE